MFELRDGSTFDWICKTKVPQDKKLVPLSFPVTFNLVDQQLVDELIMDEDTRDPYKFLSLVLVSYSGFPVKDESGADVVDNDERNEMICRSSLFINPLITAYSDGVAGHKRKN